MRDARTWSANLQSASQPAFEPNIRKRAGTKLPVFGDGCTQQVNKESLCLSSLFMDYDHFNSGDITEAGMERALGGACLLPPEPIFRAIVKKFREHSRRSSGGEVNYRAFLAAVRVPPPSSTSLSLSQECRRRLISACVRAECSFSQGIRVLSVAFRAASCQLNGVIAEDHAFVFPTLLARRLFYFGPTGGAGAGPSCHTSGPSKRDQVPRCEGGGRGREHGPCTGIELDFARVRRGGNAGALRSGSVEQQLSLCAPQLDYILCEGMQRKCGLTFRVHWHG